MPKLENGRQMPTADDLRSWAATTGGADQVAELPDMLEEAEAVHRQWRHALREGLAAVQSGFDALVRPASRVRSFQIMFIPGLLQTPDYARYRALEAIRLQGASGADQTMLIRERIEQAEEKHREIKERRAAMAARLQVFDQVPPSSSGDLELLRAALTQHASEHAKKLDQLSREYESRAGEKKRLGRTLPSSGKNSAEC